MELTCYDTLLEMFQTKWGKNILQEIKTFIFQGEEVYTF